MSSLTQTYHMTSRVTWPTRPCVPFPESSEYFIQLKINSNQLVIRAQAESVVQSLQLIKPFRGDWARQTPEKATCCGVTWGLIAWVGSEALVGIGLKVIQLWLIAGVCRYQTRTGWKSASSEHRWGHRVVHVGECWSLRQVQRMIPLSLSPICSWGIISNTHKCLQLYKCIYIHIWTFINYLHCISEVSVKGQQPGVSIACHLLHSRLIRCQFFFFFLPPPTTLPFL